MGVDDMRLVRTDPRRYEAWERECGFAFDWARLTLSVTRNHESGWHAVFTDQDGRESKWHLEADGSAFNQAAHDAGRTIPWLEYVP